MNVTIVFFLQCTQSKSKSFSIEFRLEVFLPPFTLIIKCFAYARKDQLKAMANRITNARILLLNKLKEIETPGDWSHIMKQMGMFTFTGLTQPQVVMLREKYHIYMLPNGRINMCGVNESNVDTIVQAFKDVVVNVGKL